MKLAVAAVVMAWVGCSTSSQAPSHKTSTLPEGVLAMVGTMPIDAESVAAMSSAQGIPFRDAFDRAIQDALFASAAIELGLQEAPEVRVAIRGRLARHRLELMRNEASQKDPTDDEVAEATARFFVEYDRPEAFRVVHAVVKVTEKDDTKKKARARALAEQIAQQVAPAQTEEEFRSRVDAVTDRGDLEVVVETLKPVAADGRIVDVDRPNDKGTYVAAFARAASRLSHPGQKTGLVPSEFGQHVMMLLEKTEEHRVPLEERRRLLRDKILIERARRVKKDLLAQLRVATPPAVERSAEGLLMMVKVAEHAVE